MIPKTDTPFEQKDFPEELLSVLFSACRKAEQKGEVPVAALIFPDHLLYAGPSKQSGAARKHPDFRHAAFDFQNQSDSNTNITDRIVSVASNRIVSSQDPTAHAELEAIRAACKAIGNERLAGYSLLSTLEPCIMCSGAILHARLEAVYYLCPTDKGPGLRWLLASTQKSPLHCNHYPRMQSLYQGRERFQNLLRTFFEKRR